MKRSSKVLLVISGALAAVFGVKNVIDHIYYSRGINSAPFDLNISVNALLFLLPAAVLAAVAMFKERKKFVLVIIGAVFGTIGVAEFIRQMATGSVIIDSLLIVSPYFSAVAVSAVFAAILAVKNEKKLSAVLLYGSGASALFFVVVCVVDVFSTGVYDNVMQLVTGFIMYGLFLLLPAAVMAAVALYFQRKTLFLAVGAAVCAALVVLMLVLRVLWIMTLPALGTAVACVFLAILSHRKKEV